MKRVIVTGANGFVGSNIVSALIKQGWFVYAVDVTFDNPAVYSWSNDSVSLIQSSCEALSSLPADALVHGAFITASPEARNETPETTIRHNLEPVLSMMEYAVDNQISRSIYLSSSGVFHMMPETCISEDRPRQPVGVYAVAKTTMEHLVETMRNVYGRDILCVRLGNVYGQYEYQRPSRPYLSVIGRMIHMATTTGTIEVYRPAEIREWTYACDVGSAIHALLCAETLSHSLYHVASGERKSNLTIANQIQDVVDSAVVRITDESHASKSRLTRLGTLDNSRLREDTGFNDWTPMSESVLSAIVESMVRSKADA